ncbi:uncharacterized protein LOC126844648 [Adelges cooleyi]|uniref:uncharacterized protein LOC126844648 n=1 Tax=Adelges cooleyi TaxID=133065 RepID=UPI0021803181|nr:uncharacterized protein LOC126844648 [Adelges cooleyi]XP_050438942.1 uncharacterized protein LOC126844648 [Adelges cooleyi]
MNRGVDIPKPSFGISKRKKLSLLRGDKIRRLTRNAAIRYKKTFCGGQFEINTFRICNFGHCDNREFGKFPTYRSTLPNFVSPCSLTGYKPPHMRKARIPDDCFTKNLQSSFGKSQPTNRVWVGKFCSRTTDVWLEKEFKRFGKIKQIEHLLGDTYAYVQFERVEDAVAAVEGMRKVYFANNKHLTLSIEFAVEKSRTFEPSDDSENDDEGTSSECLDDNAPPSDKPADASVSSVI